MAWLAANQPEVLCLQETKVVDDDFPTEGFQRLGYAVLMTGQKTYNGVAIATRLDPRRLVSELPGGEIESPRDQEKRFIAVTVGGIRVYCCYVPNGKALDNPSFPYKLRWLKRLQETIVAERVKFPLQLVCGDFNIAPDARDLPDPSLMAGLTHFSPDEHLALNNIIKAGYEDCYRLFHTAGGEYTWWDYRAGGFQKNDGMRIDLALASHQLRSAIISCHHDKAERAKEKPSDHIPVIVEIDDEKLRALL